MSATSSSDRFVRVLLLVVALVLAGPLLMMAFALPVRGMMGWWWGSAHASLSPVWGIVMMVLWLALLVGGGLFLARTVTQSGVPWSDPALFELRPAYARGDLSDEEFEHRREHLREGD